jgi:hypothetical protein
VSRNVMAEFRDTHCGSSNLSLTDGGSFLWTQCQGSRSLAQITKTCLAGLKSRREICFAPRGETVTNLEIITVESGEVAMELWMISAEKTEVSFAPRNVPLYNNSN